MYPIAYFSYFRPNHSRSIKHRVSSSQYCHRITHPNNCFSTAIVAVQGCILAKVNIRTERSKVRQRPQWLLETFSSHLIRAALLASWTSLGDMQYERVWTCSDAYSLPCILIEGFRCVPYDDIGTESAHGKLFVALLLRWRHIWVFQSDRFTLVIFWQTLLTIFNLRLSSASEDCAVTRICTCINRRMQPVMRCKNWNDNLPITLRLR